jgi:hypothetical protein
MRGVYPTFVPAFSLDLHPIEGVWNRITDYIDSNYPDLANRKQRSYKLESIGERSPKLGAG